MPILITEDKINIYQYGIKLYSVWIHDLSKPISEFLLDKQCNKETAYRLGHLWFSTKEKALEWINDNNLIFSKKQIKDAIINYKGKFKQCTVINENLLLKELGL